jgi:hypothetical protein
MVLTSEVCLIDVDDATKDCCQLEAVPLREFFWLLRNTTSGVNQCECVPLGGNKVWAPLLLNSSIRLARCLGATRAGATIGGFLVDDPPLIVITSFGIVIGIVIITRPIFSIFLLRLQGHEPVVLFHI